MSSPVSTFEVYFLQSEWLANRSDVAFATNDSFNPSFRRITLTTCPLYDGITRQIIGEYTNSATQIEGLGGKFVNVLTNTMIIINDKLVLPNVSSGYIYTNEKSYPEIIAAIPPKIWTQDNNGKRVLASTKPLEQGDVFGTIRFKLEVFAEDW